MSQTITSIDPMLLLEAKLVRALEEKIAEGWTIRPERFFVKRECVCCLLGSVVNDAIAPYYQPAAERLSIQSVEAEALEHGFMGFSEPGRFYDQDSFYQLGAKLRAIYVK